MGRLISFLNQFSALIATATKTGAVAKRVIDQEVLSAKPTQRKRNTQITQDLPLDEEADESNSIMKNLFEGIGCDVTPEESLHKGLIFDAEGNKIERAVQTLSGHYQVEWNLPCDDKGKQKS